MILSNAKIGEWYMTKRGPGKVVMRFDNEWSRTVDISLNGELRIYEENGFLSSRSSSTDKESFDVLYFLPIEKYPEYYL